MQWVVRADTISGVTGSVGAPTAWYGQPAAANSSHVRLSAGDSQLVLSLYPTGNPEGTQLIVTPGILGLGDGETVTASVEPLSTREFRRHWLLHERGGRLTLSGLAIAALGQSVQISLDVGEAWTLIDIGAKGVNVAKAVKGVFTIGGLALAFWQGLLKA